ncbi:hypothetical protein OHA79_01220 [Streptomyces sp. NBC_00841]|uniref:hypothetical protein n=1 Tax=Streptomyces sp. NBC_00841 TaxID=2975847 RepID=UPI002DDA6FDB|nr:hypothetical protein [Streptomyces sp. NBC_00841]WRZ96691.1 hypothetical protein OHA79_01220 [Streptomyces sp. NBC_00841]
MIKVIVEGVAPFSGSGSRLTSSGEGVVAAALGRPEGDTATTSAAPPATAGRRSLLQGMCMGCSPHRFRKSRVKVPMLNKQEDRVRQAM